MTNKPVRVLQVIRRMNRAGIETWIMHLLRHFDRREVAIDILVHSVLPGDYDEEAQALGAKILRCASTRKPLQYSRDFLRHLRENEPYDVVESHNYFFSGFDLRLATLGGVKKRIAHLHPVRDIESNRPLRGLYRRWMGRWIRKYSDLILAPSQAALNAFSQFASLGNKPQAVVRNCVNSEAFEGPQSVTRCDLGLPTDRPVIVYIARFESHKNHVMLLDLADRLFQVGVQAHFVVAGSDGSTRRAFEKRIEGRSDFSVFVNQPDLVPLLRCADLFFFPSTEEGFGIVAIEAAAAGLPVVATDLPGIREAICPGQRQFVFAQSDVESAARQVQRILMDRDLAARLSAEGRSWAKKFSIESVADDLRGIYDVGQKRNTLREAALV